MFELLVSRWKPKASGWVQFTIMWHNILLSWVKAALTLTVTEKSFTWAVQIQNQRLLALRREHEILIVSSYSVDGLLPLGRNDLGKRPLGSFFQFLCFLALEAMVHRSILFSVSCTPAGYYRRIIASNAISLKVPPVLHIGCLVGALFDTLVDWTLLVFFVVFNDHIVWEMKI